MTTLLLLRVVFAQHERALDIYKNGFNHLPKEKCEVLQKHYTLYVKKYGSRAGIEDAVVSQRRFKYEKVSRCSCQCARSVSARVRS